MFGINRGDFHLLLLMTLSERPMHGYALMQEMAKTYQRPVSAGIVYPNLQELEDMGYISADEREGRRVYSVTPEGREYLQRNREAVDRLKTGMEHAGKMGRFGILKDMRDIQAMVAMNIDGLSEDKLKRVQEIVGEAKRKVATVIFE